MNVTRIFNTATGGHETVPANWASATSLRPLLQDDPCLVWLKLHGKKHGFKKDVGPYQFLDFIGNIGRKFEDKWVKEVAPEAIAANAEDHDVRHADSVKRTLILMRRRIPVITKAALWWAPFSAYGTADLIVLASWLRKEFPQTADYLAPGPDHYVVLDVKFKTGLHTSRKKRSIRPDVAQVRLYSTILGHLQGVMPKSAFLICRDRPFDPLPVAVEHDLNGPLDAEIEDLLKSYRWIVKNGARITPWTCPLVAPNFSNTEDAPWSDAKKWIAAEFWPYTPVEKLAGIGRTQTVALRAEGIHSIEELTKRFSEKFDLTSLTGIGSAKASSLGSLLTARITGRPTPFPDVAVPPRCRHELFVDFEFLGNVHVDFDNDWPALKGRSMVFAVGVGWEERGKWRYVQFTAAAETHKAEKQMWREFLRFINAQIAGRGGDCDDVALYHWSPAEPSQARNAAERLGIDALAELPWNDLRTAFLGGGIALPGQNDWGLKSVAHALGAWSPEHRVDYPKELASGMGAMVLGWAAYASGGDPLQTREMKLIGQYLEADVQSLWAVLRWVRSPDPVHSNLQRHATGSGKIGTPPSKSSAAAV